MASGAPQHPKLDVLALPSALGTGNGRAAKRGVPALGVPLGFCPEDTLAMVNRDGPHLIISTPGMPRG